MGGGRGWALYNLSPCRRDQGEASHSRGIPTSKSRSLRRDFPAPRGHAAVLNLLRVYGKMSLIKEFSRDPAGGTPAPAHVRQEEPPCVIMLTDL